MSFASVEFLGLLAVSVPLFWALRWQRARLSVLLIASVVFYAWRHWPSVALLAGSIAFNFAAGRVLEVRRSRLVLGVAVAVNLLGLSYFKYARFFATAVAEGLTAMGAPAPTVPRTPEWLPLGISFFTFQVIAYLVDVFRGQLKAERDLLVFAVFKSFLGQLIAGPIVKGRELFPQLRGLASFEAAQAHRGLWLVGLGVFLKLGVADVIAPYVDRVWQAPGEAAVNEAWLAAIGYAAQLFGDFWGYSTVAVGVGLLFGLRLPFNFALPYLAPSLQQFWRRWHITLSAWFRDYLYVPLGGKVRRRHLNLVATMTLAGLWHGAGWTFLAWGFLHGAWLVGERVVAERTSRTLPRWVSVPLVFLGVTLLWVPFRAPTMAASMAMWRAMLLPPFRWQIAIPTEWPVWVGVFLLGHPLVERLIRDEAWTQRWSPRRQVAFALVLIWVVLAWGGAPHDFIYFVF